MALKLPPSITNSPQSNPKPSLSERVADQFALLKQATAGLNGISDEFGQPVTAVEVELKKVNLGIPSWITYFSSGPDENGYDTERFLGYAKVSGKWGIAIGQITSHYGQPSSDEEWLFHEAPRLYRLEAVDHLPALLERMTKVANETAEKLKEKIETTNEIAEAMSQSHALVNAIRRSNVIFYNTVLKHAKVDFTDDKVTLWFPPNMADARGEAQKMGGWIGLATRIAEKPVTLRFATGK